MYAVEKLEIIILKVTLTNNLCDNKIVKFHCFNPHKKQPLGASPAMPHIRDEVVEAFIV